MSAEQVFSNAKFQANAWNGSAYVTDIKLNIGSETLDATTMGASTRKHKAGLLDWSLDVTFLYDKSTSGPEANLYALVGTTSCIEFRPINECSTAKNPEFSAVATLESLPIGAGIGALLPITARWNAYSCLSRASSS